MTLPTRIDRSLWRGDNAPSYAWQFPGNFSVAGADYVLTISVGDKTIITADTYSGSLSISGNVGGRVTWSPSQGDTVLLPRGQVASYTLQRQVQGGERRTYAQGFLDAHGAT